MAWARVLSGGSGGRYTVELDYGDALRTAALAAATARLSQLDTQIAQVQVKLNEAQAKEDALRADIQAQSEQVIALMQAGGNPKSGAGGAITKYFAELQRRLGQLQAANQPIRDQLAALKFERANWRRKAAQWNTLQTKVTKQAWCVDFTENIPASAYVATCDIPGDPNLVLIAAGGRAWQASDGEFRARELLSPAQCYFNTAIFPGWQKFKPTYRWGTLTAVNYDTNRVSVSMFDQKSSAQRLSVNQASSLSNVVVAYMDCDAAVFNVGDRVVVEFQSQNWASPRVIGFLDNPKPCRGWQIYSVGLVDAGIAGPPRYLCAVFRFLASNDLFVADMTSATSVQIDFRVNGGGWQTPEGSTTAPITTGRDWQNPIGAYSGVIGGLQINLTWINSAVIDNGGAFTSQDGGPAFLRVAFFLDSGFSSTGFNAPYLPLGAIIEVRLRINGNVYANVAVKSSFSPYYVDSGIYIPPSLTDVNQLDYVRFSEE